jgi:hypothetical protein
MTAVDTKDKLDRPNEKRHIKKQVGRVIYRYIKI